MGFLRNAYYALPPSWRFLARRAWYWPKDILDAFFGSKSALAPPKGMVFTGSGDFERDGKRLVENFIEFAGLKPNHHVLDIGSGIGRVAAPLTGYLNASGAYEGFDVVEKGVLWCKENITAQYPNFQFRYVPLKNDLYTDAGNDAAQFTFPYAAETFDFACVISVFTHLLPEEVVRYCAEMHRTLKPGAKVFATFFILNEEAKVDSNPDFAFPHAFDHYALMDKKVQAGNVAFDQQWLFTKAILPEHFAVEAKYFGFWSGKDKSQCLNFQDVIILRRL